jgi:hypothetical protein
MASCSDSGSGSVLCFAALSRWTRGGGSEVAIGRIGDWGACAFGGTGPGLALAVGRVEVGFCFFGVAGYEDEVFAFALDVWR